MCATTWSLDHLAVVPGAILVAKHLLGYHNTDPPNYAKHVNTVSLITISVNTH